MATRTRPNAGTKGVARADREQQILEVACRAFGESGFAGTSVVDVAEAAGISKPLIYNYFGSKEGLYAACVQHAAATLTAEIERTAASGTVGLARAVVTLDGMFRVLAPQPWLWRLVFDPTAPDDPATAQVLADYERRIFDFGVEGVSELLHLAGNDDPTDTSAMRAVWENVFRTLVTWWLEHAEESPEEMTQRCIRLFSAVFGEIDTSVLTRTE
ncbi:MAG TPA: TetR/AcrR family transcriptional regulator [Marmoricola sp.]|jgi:AcrR family transcriptional regulator|nr:TetR/AcrR family transcriptional regulator [Marmoricola sp.]